MARKLLPCGESASVFEIELLTSREDVIDNVAMHVRQAAFDAVVIEGQLFVVDPQ